MMRRFLMWISIFIFGLANFAAGFSPDNKTYAQSARLPGDCTNGPSHTPTEGGGTWTHPGPGFWMYTEVTPEFKREHYHTDGLAGYAWSLENIWAVRVSSTLADMQKNPTNPSNQAIYDAATQDYLRVKDIVQSALQHGVDPATSCQGEDYSNNATAEASTGIANNSFHAYGYAWNDTQWPAVTNWDVSAANRDRGERLGDDEARHNIWFGNDDPSMCYGSSQARSRYGYQDWELVEEWEYSQDSDCQED